MKLIRAGLDGDVHGSAAGHTLLGIEAVAHQVDGLDGLDRRQISDQARQPRVADGGTVQTSRIEDCGMPLTWVAIERCGLPASE